MKRMWFALAFLLIISLACVAEQHYIHRFYHEMSSRIESAKTHEQNDAQFKKDVDEIQRYWQQHNDLMFTITNHGVLDDLSAVIRALTPVSKEEDLNKAQAILNVFYENQKITLANIF